MKRSSDSIKPTNIFYYRDPRWEERGAENIFENIITANFLNQGKETDIQVQKTSSPKHNQPKDDHIKTGYT